MIPGSNVYAELHIKIATEWRALGELAHWVGNDLAHPTSTEGFDGALERVARGVEGDRVAQGTREP